MISVPLLTKIQSGKVLTGFIIIILSLMLGCQQSDYNPPADHTISKDGIMHKSGLNEAEVNCVSCHGDDLRGGSAAVSCYECHNKKW